MSVAQEPRLRQELQRALLFSALDDKQLAAVLVSSHHYTPDAESRLFEQGERARRFFWIRSGTVKLSRLSPSGEEKIIEVLSSGQTFAEALMFMGEHSTYPVTAQTLERSEIIGFENAAFLSVLRQSVETSFRLMAAMSQRLHGLISDIDQLTLQTATARVADFLIARSSETGEVDLGMPKHVVASRLSIKPETLSRIFARLSGQGILAVTGTQINIRDAKALHALVEAET